MQKVIIVLIIIFSFFSVTAQENETANAKILVFQNDIFVKVDAIIENTDLIYDDELNYLLVILIKNPNSNKVEKHEQKGEFTVTPNEKKVLTTLELNIESNQELTVFLYIKIKERLISSDVKVINEVVSELETNKLEEDEIEIKGLVVENVKTVIGKNFYDVFYQKYSSTGVQYPFVIDINEKPFIGGRGSLISIDVGDDNIFEFQARPDEELYIKVSNYALKLIDNYNKNRSTYEKIY